MGEAYLDWQKKSGGIKLNDVIEEYKYVAAGKQIKAGDLVNYINGIAGETDYGESVDTTISTAQYAGETIYAILLDDNRVFIAHSYGENRHLYGVVCTINGATITYGTDTQLSTTSYTGSAISAVALDKNRVFIAFSYGSSHVLYSVVCTIDGTTITKGTLKQLDSTTYSGSQASSVLLPSGNVFVSHSYKSSYNLYGIVCTISDTTITAGTNTQLASGAATTMSQKSVLLPNGKVFTAYHYGGHNGNDRYLYGTISTVSGTSITTGTATKIVGTQNSGYDINPVVLDENHIFIAHTTNSALYSVVCTVSGTTITVGTDIQLKTEVSLPKSVILLRNGNILIVYGYSTNYYLYGMILSVIETTMTIVSNTQLSTTQLAGYRSSTLMLNNETLFMAHSYTSYYLYAQIFCTDTNSTITNNIVVPDYEEQITPAIEPPFNAVALSSGVGGTETEHNEQVKIARPNVGVI